MATNGKLVSIERVLQSFYRNFPLDYALTWEDAIEWIGDLLTQLNAPVALINKTELITITDGKGKLPCDLESIIQTARAEPTISGDTQFAVIASQDQGTFLVEGCGVDLVNRELITDCKVGEPSCEFILYPMRWATNSFHQKFHLTDWDYRRQSVRLENTYTVNNNYIFTSFSDGYVLMAYRAVPTDERGYPMVPGDQRWINAMVHELAWKVIRRMRLMGSFTDKDMAREIERDRDWYVAQAVNGSKIPSIDEMESWKNEWLRTIPKVNHHQNFFRNMQAPEQRYIHPLRFNW